MPKRKRATAAGEDPDLSLPPKGLLDGREDDDGSVNGHALKAPGKKRKVQVKKDTEEIVEESGSKKKSTGKQSVKTEEIPEAEIDPAEPPKRKRVVKQKVKAEDVEENGKVVDKKVTRKRKTKEEKEAEAMPLAARTVGHKLYIGAHVSSAGGQSRRHDLACAIFMLTVQGVHNSITNSLHIGANAFALFLKSQRKWANPPLADDHSTSFHGNCKSHAYDQGKHVVPHGSYLVNLAHTDKARTDQAYESYLDDLKRCERLGIELYNIHPGNTVSNDRHSAIAHLAANINRAHKETHSVVTLLENMAAGGNVLGSTFEDLRDIIALVTEKERIGVCLDTCHAFAAGYDLRSPEAFKHTMSKLDSTVGFKYLRALHVNDSKAPFSSHRDLHANIGTGFLGLRAFHNIVNETRFVGLPLVLETPIEVRDADGHLVKDEKGKEKEDKGIWAREVKMLESMVGMDVESEEFQTLEKTLARKGEPERTRFADQAERRKEKDAKKGKGRKGKRKGKESEESELSELDEE